MSLKLASGEEIITRITGCQNGILTLDHPRFLARTQQGYQFVPGMITCPQDTVHFNESQIMMFGVTTDAIKDKYVEAITGIKVPEKSIILG